jgi:hypothetical protein
MNRSPLSLPVLFLLGLCATFSSVCAESPFIGRWALTIPGGGAGWLGVEEKGGAVEASVLWGGGSVLPAQSAKIDGDTLTVVRGAGKGSETITAHVTGDDLNLTTVKKNGEGKELSHADFTGKRIPPVPPTPDLSKVKFGDPITLFNGKDLDGWKLVNPKSENGWSVVNGELLNRIEPGKHLGNLRTEREFEDFNLKLETRTQAGSNSGIYLRGIYEIQVAESFGKPLDPHNMGALYSRITPSVAAAKPIGEWQTFDITLVDRHVTVILNGQKIIDNQPVLGCTGGALTSDESKPGPLMLQGDHTNIDYRNIVLRPVVK